VDWSRARQGKMIQPVYVAIFSEMGVILTLIFRNPLRKFVIMGLDRVKRGRGPVVVKTVAGTILVLLLSNVYSIGNMQNRKMEAGALNPTEEVLMAMQLLQASLLGILPFFFPFLWFAGIVSFFILLIHFLERKKKEEKKEGYLISGKMGC